MRKKQTLGKYEDVKERALRLIAFREHSTKELIDKLTMDGAEQDYIDKTVEFCTEYGFLNDEAYAMHKASDLSKIKHYGKHRIAIELAMKGISSDIIENTLEEIEDSDDILLPLVEKRLKGDIANRDRVIRYFASHGYEIEQIKKCIERALDV